MAFNKRKFAKKTGRFLTKKVVRPYITGGGKRTHSNRMKLVSNLAQEVAQIRKLINVEKKRNVISLTSDQPIGQVNGNSQGWYAVDITPTPSQGDTASQRNGDSIKLTGSNMLFNIRQMSQTHTQMKCKVVIFHIKGVGQPYVPATFIDDIYYQNTFVLNGGSPAIIDYNSQLDMYEQRGYSILAVKTITLPYDQLSGVTCVKNFRIGLKYKNHHVKYQNGTTTINNGQIIMYVQPDVGNASSSTASTLTGLAVSAINTGALLNYNITHYYVDN